MSLVDVPLPGPGVTLGNTQNPIRQNFLDIDSGFAVNHAGFNGVNAGMHNSVQMPVQTMDPSTTINSVALVAKAAVLGTGTQLFFQPANNVASYEITSSLKNNNGWTILPSGIILQWGQFTQPINTANSNFTYPIPFPNAALSITGNANLLPSGDHTDIIFAINIYPSNPQNKTTFAVARKQNFGSSLTFAMLAIGW